MCSNVRLGRGHIGLDFASIAHVRVKFSDMFTSSRNFGANSTQDCAGFGQIWIGSGQTLRRLPRSSMFGHGGKTCHQENERVQVLRNYVILMFPDWGGEFLAVSRLGALCR